MKDTDSKLIFEAYGTPSRAANPGFGSDGNAPEDTSDADSGWTREGLKELKPNELVEFINEALPKFLQTHYDPESYDEIHAALYKAAYIIDWNSTPDDAFPESYAGAHQLRQAQLARAAGGAGGASGSGGAGMFDPHASGETLAPPDSHADLEELVKTKVRDTHGWDVEKDGDGKWWRLDAPGGERPVTGDEHWDIMRIEDPGKAAEYARKQNPG